MTRMMELVEAARLVDARYEEKKRQEAQGQAAERKATAAVALGRFISWLGELADDFEIKPTSVGLNTGEEWGMHPRHWRLDHAIRLTYSVARGVFELSLGLHTCIVCERDTPFSPEDTENFFPLAAFLRRAEDWYQNAMDGCIARAMKKLVTVTDPGCRDDRARVDDALAELMRLAPERAAEWDALYAAWQTQHDALLAEQAATQAEYDAVLEMYRQQMEAWADECAAVDEANRAAVAALQERVNKPVYVREIEYAVVADNDAYGPHVETRTAYGSAPENGAVTADAWTIIERGRARDWTFRNIVRISDILTVYPADDPYNDTLFLRRATAFGLVAFSHVYEHRVEEELKRLLPPPDEPALPAGLEWGKDVEKIASAARSRASWTAGDPF